MRGIFYISAENTKTEDCLAERGRFEPPRLFGIRSAELGPSLAYYSAQKKASVLKRIGSPGIRLFFGSLPVPLVRYADAQNLVTSNIRRTFGVRISPRLGGQSAVQVCLLPSPNADVVTLHPMSPFRFDVARAEPPHIRFGTGEYFCLGARLAEMQICPFYEEFVRRYPGRWL
jgi:hypothetical protein